MNSSVVRSISRRIVPMLLPFLALPFSGCMSATDQTSSMSTSTQLGNSYHNHTGGWGTGFGSDGSRGRS